MGDAHLVSGVRVPEFSVVARSSGKLLRELLISFIVLAGQCTGRP